MTFPPAGARKLALDEESFQQLLAAAYALQENKDVLWAGNSSQDSAAVFSEIGALRAQVLAQVDALEPHVVSLKNANPKNANPKPAAEAADLVAECLRHLTKADGASVCLIVDGYLRPTAYAGTAAKVSGGSVASNSLVATERLRNGRAFQSANACSDIRLGPSVCLKLQIGSLLAFPIERHNQVAGIIEARWTKADAFSEGDERICQLMANLMAEVLEGEDGRVNAQVTHPIQATAPRSAIAELATPIAKSDARNQELSSSRAIVDAAVASSDPICRVCGKPLSDDVNFCGSCGMLSASPDNGLQGKWASMWFMQQAQKAVDTEQGRERLWPLHTAHAEDAETHLSTASPTENSSDDTETDEHEESSAERKHSPRGVLAVLKSRLRPRAIGQ